VTMISLVAAIIPEMHLGLPQPPRPLRNPTSRAGFRGKRRVYRGFTRNIRFFFPWFVKRERKEMECLASPPPDSTDLRASVILRRAIRANDVYSGIQRLLRRETRKATGGKGGRAVRRGSSRGIKKSAIGTRGKGRRLRSERRKVLNGREERGRENSDHNVILTEITPPRSPRDNKFATLLADPRIV